MPRNLGTLILLLFSSFLNFGQSVDSLKNIYPSSTPAEQISILLQLSELTRKDSFPLGFQYANQALIQAKKIENSVLAARSYQQMGIIYQQLENVDSAISCFRHSLNEVSCKDEPQFCYELLMKLGNVFFQNDQLDSAICYYDKALEKVRIENKPDKLMRVYDALTRAYYNQSDYRKVVEFLEEKLRIAEKVNDSLEIANSYSYLSINKRKLGFYKEALRNNQKALGLYQKLKDSLGLADCYQGLGGIYYFMDDNEQAIKQFKKALDIFGRLKKVDKQAALNNNIGSVYNEMGDFDKALFYYKKALDMYSQQGNQMAEAIIADNIGLAYLGLKKYVKARFYFIQSLEVHKRIGNNEGVVHAMTNIAGLHQKQNNMDMAREQYLEALKLARQGNLLNEELAIYKELVGVEESLGNLKEALETMRNFQIIKDTMLNQESRMQLNELEAKMNSHDQENKIILLSKENELNLSKVDKQQIKTRFVIVLLFLVLIVLVLVIIALRFSKKAKKKLEEQNQEILTQRNEIQIQNKRFIDSIQYAGRVQNALLSPIEKLSDYFADYFLLSHPFGIVSGDFYWFRYQNNKLYLALADCTGHGVPGAFMSILGNTYLNEIVIHFPDYKANEVLNELRNQIKINLHQENMQGNTDGMDISLCIIRFDEHKLEFAGAYNPVFVLRGDQLTELSADKMPIAVSRNERQFSIQQFDFQKSDRLFFTSDGFYDQFGGAEGSKITRKGFKNLLIAGNQLPLSEQGKMIESYFLDWKGEREQTDDVMVLGCRF